MKADLEGTYRRFQANAVDVVDQLRSAPDVAFVRLAHDRMLELRGKGGVDEWRVFLGVVGLTQHRMLERLVGAGEADPDDYLKALELARWWSDWSRARTRAERVRAARVQGEPRPTVTALIERDGVACWRCGKNCDVEPEDAYWTIDPETGRGLERNPRYRTVGHVTRIVDGGKDTMDNARLECWECNSADGLPVFQARWW